MFIIKQVLLCLTCKTWPQRRKFENVKYKGEPIHCFDPNKHEAVVGNDKNCLYFLSHVYTYIQTAYLPKYLLPTGLFSNSS